MTCHLLDARPLLSLLLLSHAPFLTFSSSSVLTRLLFRWHIAWSFCRKDSLVNKGGLKSVCFIMSVYTNTCVTLCYYMYITRKGLVAVYFGEPVVWYLSHVPNRWSNDSTQAVRKLNCDLHEGHTLILHSALTTVPIPSMGVLNKNAVNKKWVESKVQTWS